MIALDTFWLDSETPAPIPPSDAAREAVSINRQMALALRTVMGARGISLIDLAEAIGEDEADLEAVYSGDAEMTVAQMVQLHRYFGTHPSAWLGAIVETGPAGALRFDDAGRIALRILALPRMAQELLLARASKITTPRKDQSDAS